VLTATCASCIVQDVKSTTELVAQDRLYLDEGTPDCGNFKVLNILKEYTHEEQQTIVAFDALTFTCLPEWVGNLNKLREVSASYTAWAPSDVQNNDVHVAMLSVAL
jgi:hypothetical protein